MFLFDDCLCRAILIAFFLLGGILILLLLEVELGFHGEQLLLLDELLPSFVDHGPPHDSAEQDVTVGSLHCDHVVDASFESGHLGELLRCLLQEPE